MTLLLAFFLQAAVAPMAIRPSAAPAATRVLADTTKPIDPATAVGLFKSLCWDSFRDPATFHAALGASPVTLAPAPPPATADPTQPGELFRSDEAVLSYVASDSLPASIPSRQCSLRVRLAGGADQLALAARIGAALAIPSGRTRTGPTLSITTWDVTGADQRTTRLLAVSHNGRAGGTELRLWALLLAARPAGVSAP